MSAKTKSKVLMASKDDAKDPHSKPTVDYPTGGWVPELTDWRVAVPNAVTAILVSLIVCVIAVSFVEELPKQREILSHQTYYFPKIAAFVFGYYIFLGATRWYESDSHVLYEMLWGCNMAMLFCVVGMLTNSPLLSGLSAAMVAVDQMFWYVDVLGFLITGCKKFPVGVARYLLWPSTGRMKKITAWHHIWFLPLLLYTLDFQFPNNSFPMAVFMTFVLAITARMHTPFHCLLPLAKGETEHKVLYLNINFAYGFWKDIHVKFLHVLDHGPFLLYLPFIVITANLLLNFPAYCVLLGLLKLAH